MRVPQIRLDSRFRGIDGEAMSLAVFLAILFAALLHAGWNALVKTGLDHFSSILVLALVQGGIAVLLLPFFDLPARAAWP